MSVQPQEWHFDDESIDHFLNGELPAADAQELETHLNTCEQCTERMMSIAAKPWGWDRVSTSLIDDDFDHPSPKREVQTASSARVPLNTALGAQDADDGTLLRRELSGWLGPSDDPEMLGRFAGYEIVGIVGHGGMGIVLKGFERSLNRYVAIKLLAPRLASNGTARKRFQREARAAAAVLHDNVIAIHRVDQWHGLPLLVMPYVTGESLQQRIDREGPLGLEATLRIGQQIAAGLAAAHRQGLVHRDIKPANILLDQGVERVTITDFGLARAADDARITRSGFVTGTPQYMSPEQAAADSIDHRSDLFSLGSVMYTMATGRSPFEDDEQLSVLNKIRNPSTLDARELQETVPKWLAELIDWCHAKKPEDRPQSAAEIEHYLGEWVAHMKQPHRAGEPAPLAIPKAARRDNSPPKGWGRVLIAGLGGLLFVLASIFITLETSKGTITIESEADNVQVVIKKNGQIYDKQTVNRGGSSIRVYQGEYEITFDGNYEHLEIESGLILLKRGQEPVVRIREVASAKEGEQRASLSASDATSPTIQVLLSQPSGILIHRAISMDSDTAIESPARLDLRIGVTHQLYLTKVPGFDDAAFRATIEIRKPVERVNSYLDHNVAAIGFTRDDFEQASTNHLVLKVFYLPGSQTTSRLETLDAARAGSVDPVGEAARRGEIVAVVRLARWLGASSTSTADWSKAATGNGQTNGAGTPVGYESALNLVNGIANKLRNAVVLDGIRDAQLERKFHGKWKFDDARTPDVDNLVVHFTRSGKFLDGDVEKFSISWFCCDGMIYFVYRSVDPLSDQSHMYSLAPIFDESGNTVRLATHDGEARCTMQKIVTDQSDGSADTSIEGRAGARVIGEDSYGR